MKTGELCFAAVTRNGWALSFVLDELKTAELCITTVKQTKSVLRFIPVKMIARKEKELGI